ncbi:hypothetical protein AURDEDRAFT_150303, partial [Auricularia subglabra TFB-10046 SS5]
PSASATTTSGTIAPTRTSISSSTGTERFVPEEHKFASSYEYLTPEHVKCNKLHYGFP